MTDPTTDTADIAWLRNLAAEGATAPMRGGSTLMAAGLIFGFASLVHWAIAAGMLALRPSAFSFVWLGATALFLATLILTIVRRSGSGGVRTAIDRVSRAVWSAVGWGIFALFGSIALIAMRLGEPSIVLLTLTPSIIMVFYGLGWAVSAAITRSRPLGGLAVASFIAAPLLALMFDQSAQYLAYAGCLFALMAVPGFLLMRAAKQG